MAEEKKRHIQDDNHSTPGSSIVPVRLVTEAPRSGTFVSFMQGPLTNRLNELSSRSKRMPMQVDEISDVATLAAVNNRNDTLFLFLQNYSMLTSDTDANGNKKISAGIFKTSTKKLLDVIITEFSRKNALHAAHPNLEVQIPLSHYLTLLGKANTKPNMNAIRRSVTADLQTLYAASLRWNDNTSDDYVETRLISSHGIKNSVIRVTLSAGLGLYLCNSFKMTFNLQSIALDERNPSAYSLSRKLQVQWHMNQLRRAERQQDYDIISVDSLLAVCPEIPTAEEVSRSADRHIRARIIDPFEQALEILVENRILRYWEYCAANGTPLSNSELADNHNFFKFHVRYRPETNASTTEI